MNHFTMTSSHTALQKITHSISLILLGLILTSLTGCGSGGGEGTPAISTSGTPAGVTASLAWNPVQDSTVYAYYVHYGKQSSGQPGSCIYSDSMYVSSPSATIIGLDPNTKYYFAVSAYNGLSGPCSNEVSAVTPAA